MQGLLQGANNQQLPATLSRANVQDLRRSGRPVAEDWPEFAQYARSNGSYITPYLNLNEAVGDERDEVSPETEGWGHGQQLQQQQQQQQQTTERSQDELAPLPPAHTRGHDDSSPLASPVVQSPLLEESVHGSHTSLPGVRGRTSRASLRGWAQRKATRAPTVFARDRAIEKQALVDSAERIYLRYLLPGAEREIYLPPALRMTNFPVSENGHVSPQIPDLFHAQKLFIFRALEQDAFPRFLRAKAFGNLTPMSSLLHLILGLIVLWGAFVLAFTFIFLDWSPKSHRLYVIIPFFFAFNLLLAAYYSLSPILAFLFQSETTPFHLITIREAYVRKLLFLRALWVEALAILLTAIFTIIFTLVPGKRL